MLIPFFGMAQTPNSQQALELYQNNQLKEAMEKIDQAIADPAESSDAFVWHLRGYIYKDFFKTIEKESRNSLNREVAIESYMKSSELDTAKEYEKNNFINLRYLVTSYFNDAVRTMEDTSTLALSESFYLKYKAGVKRIGEKINENKTDVDFYNALGSRYVARYNRFDTLTVVHWEKAIETYKRVLELDPDNCLANYQIGMLYYNRGVDVIFSLDPETPLQEIMKAQDICLDLFMKSKPYLVKAWELKSCDNLVEIAEGLSGIYYQLNMPDKHEYWKSVIKDLQGQQKEDE